MMKKKISFILVITLSLTLIFGSAAEAFASSVDLERYDYEIANIPDRIAITDEPITLTEIQYENSDGSIRSQDCFLNIDVLSPEDSKVIQVTDNSIEDEYSMEQLNIVITPKKVGTATLLIKASLRYYKKIFVYDPEMSAAERDTPQNVKIQKYTPKQLYVSWDEVYGASKYMVYRSKTGKDGTFKKIKTTSKLYCYDKKLTSGKTYYYKVKAVTEDGVSNFSKTKKCRVARKLNFSVDFRNLKGRSASYVKIGINNYGKNKFIIDQDVTYIGGREFVTPALYRPYSGASFSQAKLVNGSWQTLSKLTIPKKSSRIVKFSLDSTQIPSNGQSIAFNARYDGIPYHIFAFDDGSIYYQYGSFSYDSDLSYKDFPLYQLK